MGEIIGPVPTVLPAFTLACPAAAARTEPSTALILHQTVRDGRGIDLAAASR